ncbi:MAG: Sulfate adenylyltransferase [Cenarchaeum symbiont of Oopsacas minuta]|nr:Sulfate adenylyltransferase [Cenarchaeum symbiont of Oopsacas minuta]
MGQIPKPHGGTMVDRHASKNTSGMEEICISASIQSDVENIADGVFSPLEGFLGREDFESVVSFGRLANGTTWTIPIVLDLNSDDAKKAKNAGSILLRGPDATAILYVDETFSYDKTKMSNGIFGTCDEKHPGVARVNSMKDTLVSGKIHLVEKPKETPIRRYRMTPIMTRKAFKDAGWNTIAAFQTRNPPHVAHEMLQKTAAITRDGVFVNPLVGKKKSGDFTDEVIIKTYEVMIENYYPKNKCILATLHTEMRYAGPKEAIHHAIMRQNYGCTHIIIGRDHAGVGNYYDPFAAHKIFSDYKDLQIEPIFFPPFFYCKKCLTFTSPNACPHDTDAREQISGTRLREMLQNGQSPSEFILRPEVSKVIMSHEKPFIE